MKLHQSTVLIVRDASISTGPEYSSRTAIGPLGSAPVHPETLCPVWRDCPGPALGHRTSIDYDFFSASSFEPLKLFQSLASFENKQAVQVAEDTLTCVVETGAGPCRVSFFGGLTIRQINIPDISDDNNIAVASFRDIFGMKCATVPARSESKDYLDIHALVTMSGLKLAEGIAAAKAIYGNQYNPMQTLQALCYFDDLPEPLSDAARSDLLAAVNEVNLDRLPELTARYRIAEGV